MKLDRIYWILAIIAVSLACVVFGLDLYEKIEDRQGKKRWLAEINRRRETEEEPEDEEPEDKADKEPETPPATQVIDITPADKNKPENKSKNNTKKNEKEPTATT